MEYRTVAELLTDLGSADEYGNAPLPNGNLLKAVYARFGPEGVLEAYRLDPGRFDNVPL